MNESPSFRETLYLQKDGPFYDLTTLHQTVCVGLALIYSENFIILHKSREEHSMISWESSMGDNIIQHFHEMLYEAKTSITHQQVNDSLNCLIANLAYERIKDIHQKTQIIEVLRHIRNAASHGNMFNFNQNEPRETVVWKKLEINGNTKGNKNPLHGRRCFGEIIFSGDLFYLLNEIEQDLPDRYFKTKNLWKIKQ